MPPGVIAFRCACQRQNDKHINMHKCARGIQTLQVMIETRTTCVPMFALFLLKPEHTTAQDMRKPLLLVLLLLLLQRSHLSQKKLQGPRALSMHDMNFNLRGAHTLCRPSTPSSSPLPLARGSRSLAHYLPMQSRFVVQAPYCQNEKEPSS